MQVLSVTENGYTRFLHRSDIGLGSIGVAGLISAVSAFFLLVYLLCPRVRSLISTSAVSTGVGQFVKDPLGWFMVNMLLSDLLQGAAFIINIVWAKHSAIWVGPACTAQGAVSEVGDVGCAIFSLLITLHTFLVLFMRWTPPKWASVAAILVSWAVILFLAMVGPLYIERKTGNGTFYGNSGAWCWISSKYQVERFFFLYFFVFLSSGSSWICYSLVYLRTRHRAAAVGQRQRRRAENPSADNASGKSIGHGIGAMSFTSTMAEELSSADGARAHKGEGAGGVTREKLLGGGHSDTLRAAEEAGVSPEEAEGREEDDTIKAMSTRMLWYPIAYSCIIIPVAISRLSVMNHTPVPLAFVMFSGILFSSSGTVNVILWLATRQSYIAREARRIPYSVTTTVEVSPPSDYELGYLHEGAMGNTDALMAAKLDLDRRALDASPFTDGELVLSVQAREVGRRGRRRSTRLGSADTFPGRGEGHSSAEEVVNSSADADSRAS